MSGTGNESSQSQTLAYEAPRDGIVRRRELRGLIPQSQLGIVASVLAGVEIGALAVMSGMQDSGDMAGWMMVIDWFTSVCIGVPMSIGALNEKDRRKRFGVIGLLLHVLIVLGLPCGVIRFVML